MFGLSDIVVKLLMALAVVAALTAAKVTYDHGQQKVGYNNATAELQPKLTAAEGNRDKAVAANKALSSDLDKLRSLLAESNGKLDNMAKEDKQRSDAARAILLAAAAKLGRAAGEVKRLQAIAANPTISRNDCEEAFGIIDGVLSSRMPAGQGGAAIDVGRSNPASGSAGEDSLRRHEGHTRATGTDPRDSGHGIEETKGGSVGR